MDYVIGAKVKGNAKLFQAFDHRRHSEQSILVIEFEQTDLKTGITQGCRFSNQLPRNDSRKDLRVNLMEFWEVNAKGKITQWSWVTNLAITSRECLGDCSHRSLALGHRKPGLQYAEEPRLQP